jgi:predicted RNA-binding Zn ribbon-like protein
MSKQFELMGDALCLDFVNTIHVYGAEDPHEELHTFADLVSFSQQAGAITKRQAEALYLYGDEEPQSAARTLSLARESRNAMYRIFSAVALGKSPAPQELEILNRNLSRALPNLRIGKRASGFEWEWNDKQFRAERVLWPLVRSAADLLTGRERELIRECGSDTCTWMFLDRSKNRTRRWCDMTKCGNRAKWRRYYERRKKQ